MNILRNNGKKSLPCCLVFFFLFCFFAFLMWCSPAASDDYAFASLDFADGDDFISYLLYYGNGRLLGNAGGILMSRIPLLDCLVRAFFLSTFVYLFPAALNLKGPIFRLASFLLVFGVEANIFSEVFSWTCGFANYIPPIWIILLILCLLRIGFSSNTRCCHFLCPAVFLLALFAQLYVEHTAIIQILLAIACLIHSGNKEKYQKLRLPSIFWLAGSLLGFLILMGIPVLFSEEGSPVSSYRGIALQDLPILIRNCAQNTIRTGNVWTGTTAIALCMVSLSTTWLGRENRGKACTRKLFAASGSALFLLFFSALLDANNWYGSQALFQRLIGTVIMAVLLLVWLIAVCTLESGSFRQKQLILFALCVVSLLMILPIYPFSARTTFQAYLFVAAAFLLCLNRLIAGLPPQGFLFLHKALAVSAIALSLTLGLIFLDCKNLDDIRKEHITQQLDAGANDIEIFEIPHDHAKWESGWGISEYYDREQPGDVRFSLYPYINWSLKYQDSGLH